MSVSSMRPRDGLLPMRVVLRGTTSEPVVLDLVPSGRSASVALASWPRLDSEIVFVFRGHDGTGKLLPPGDYFLRVRSPSGYWQQEPVQVPDSAL
jgi:hypothetical protein